MGASTVVEWLNENGQRAYPLTINSSRFLQVGTVSIDLFSLILDANFVFGQLPDDIKLTQVSRSGSTLIFTVAGLPTFSLNTTGAFPAYVRNSHMDLLTIGESALDFIAAMFDGTNVAVDSVYFEPSVAIEMSGELLGVSSITLGGVNITSGDIVLAEGYQTDIQFGDQVVKLAIGRSEGVPLGCINFFPVLPNESCDAIISSINGASPRASGGIINLRAGQHVKIYEDPEKGRIYIGLDFKPTDTTCTTNLPPKQ